MGEILSPLARKALFKAAVTLHQTTAAQAAEDLGVSYNHLMLVLAGDRIGSVGLQHRIAAYLDRPLEGLFPPKATKATVSGPT